MKEIIRKLLIILRIPVTKNIHYDILTIKLMKSILKQNSNCIDIGGFKGEILSMIVNLSPGGKHFSFEPIPEYFQYISEKFSASRGKNLEIYNLALSDTEGEARFNWVNKYPAYSGLKVRDYPEKNTEITEITVKTARLDSIIPESLKIDFIKIDVEGAEYSVLKGGKNILLTSRPVILFEFGVGASNYYEVTPEQIFRFFDEEVNYSISLIDQYLKGQAMLSQKEFHEQYHQRLNYYFIAFPKEIR